MIPLRLRVKATGWNEELAVVRLLSAPAPSPTMHDVVLVGTEDGKLSYAADGRRLDVASDDAPSLDGNIVLLSPARGTLQRLIRPNSAHNTLLVTERCDQLCVMCSQPPNTAEWNLFEFYLQAVRLAPRDAVIGISGGEPTLLLDDLLNFLSILGEERPDLRFHVLTNAQHLTATDVGRLRALHLDRIEWGVPVYASAGGVHDRIVGKSGAFERLQRSLSFLARAGARIEIRTVVTTMNYQSLPALASYLAVNVPFAETWALMQLENIGYGRLNWNSLFIDTGEDFGPLGRAIAIAAGRGLVPRLYNFPLCTLPKAYRKFSVASISDWKQKYLPTCSQCSLQSTCGGFFQWYPEDRGFGGVKPE